MRVVQLLRDDAAHGARALPDYESSEMPDDSDLTSGSGTGSVLDESPLDAFAGSPMTDPDLPTGPLDGGAVARRSVRYPASADVDADMAAFEAREARRGRYDPDRPRDYARNPARGNRLESASMLAAGLPMAPLGYRR
jgi:hypothetical protein